MTEQLENWYQKEIKVTEESMTSTHKRLGGRVAPNDPTYNFLAGYLSGLKNVYKRVVMSEALENRSEK